jgi:hypothetical protein
VIAVTYTCRNSDGFDVPSYFFGRCGRNLDGHDAAEMICESSAAHAGQGDTHLGLGAYWGLRCHRSEVLIKVATLNVLSALARPL